MAGGTASLPEGNAIVYCEGNFGTTNGKTAHGLVRFTNRYRVVAVIDSRRAGNDAAALLDGTAKGIPVVDGLRSALEVAEAAGICATHFVVGLAPDGGRLRPADWSALREAAGAGLHIDSGLHDFVSDNPEIASIAGRNGSTIRDIRKTPPRDFLHFFSGKIEQVDSLKVAMLGTDSAIGKRTSSWILVRALEASGCSAEMVGTGQTAWMQGARYGIIMDSLVNDFVSGEIEHAVWSAWDERHPQVIVIEGQGSLMNPAYPGGFEILAAGRPDAVVLQHAPARKEYDGFPGYPLHPLADQIRAVEFLSGRPVVAVTINHEGLSPEEIESAVKEIEDETGLPACDPLVHGAGKLVRVLEGMLRGR